jgi:hypothetical protein
MEDFWSINVTQKVQHEKEIAIVLFGKKICRFETTIFFERIGKADFLPAKVIIFMFPF